MEVKKVTPLETKADHLSSVHEGLPVELGASRANFHLAWASKVQRQSTEMEGFH